MEEADMRLKDGRRLLQTSDFGRALDALKRRPTTRVAVFVEFTRLSGTSGHSGDEIEQEGLTLFNSWNDPKLRWQPASRFIEAAADHGDDLAAAATDLALRRENVVPEAEEFDSVYHVTIAEGPVAVRINWMDGYKDDEPALDPSDPRDVGV